MTRRDVLLLGQLPRPSRRLRTLLLGGGASVLASGCTLAFDLSDLDKGSEDGSPEPSEDGQALEAAPVGDAGPDASVPEDAADAADAAREVSADVEVDARDGATDREEPAADSRADVVDASADVHASDSERPDASEDAGADAKAATDAADATATCAAYELVPTGVTASTNRSPNVASDAIDENFATRWESIQSKDVDGASVDPQWIYVDYGTDVSVSQIQVIWESACARDYQVQVSEDASNWATVASVTGNTNGSAGAPSSWTGAGAVSTTGFTGTGRYLRIYMTARCSSLYGDSLWEMRAFGYIVKSCD